MHMIYDSPMELTISYLHVMPNCKSVKLNDGNLSLLNKCSITNGHNTTSNCSSQSTGIVLKWFHEKSFGYIQRDDNGEEILCFPENCDLSPLHRNPKVGSKVSFIVENGKRGNADTAMNVTSPDGGKCEGGRSTGIISRWNEKKRYGIITADDHSDDWLVSLDLDVWDSPETIFKVGDAVEFDRKDSDAIYVTKRGNEIVHGQCQQSRPSRQVRSEMMQKPIETQKRKRVYFEDETISNFVDDTVDNTVDNTANDTVDDTTSKPEVKAAIPTKGKKTGFIVCCVWLCYECQYSLFDINTLQRRWNHDMHLHPQYGFICRDDGKEDILCDEDHTELEGRHRSPKVGSRVVCKSL